MRIVNPFSALELTRPIGELAWPSAFSDRLAAIILLFSLEAHKSSGNFASTGWPLAKAESRSSRSHINILKAALLSWSHLEASSLLNFLVTMPGC